MTDATYQEILDVLRYEPITGEFYWKRTLCSRAQAGARCGNPDTDGYVKIRFRKRLYHAHRLARLLMTGSWPSFEIDHRDLNRANNRWGNLRPASRSQQNQNKTVQANNRARLKGAHWSTLKGCWSSAVRRDGVTQWLGYFPTAELAHAAYRNAASIAHGEYART